MKTRMYLAQNLALFVENEWWQGYLTKGYGNTCLQLTLHSIVQGKITRLGRWTRLCLGHGSKTQSVPLALMNLERPPGGRRSNELRTQRGLPRPLSGSNWLSKELETIGPPLTSIEYGQNQNYNPIEHCSWISFFGLAQHGADALWGQGGDGGKPKIPGQH